MREGGKRSRSEERWGEIGKKRGKEREREVEKDGEKKRRGGEGERNPQEEETVIKRKQKNHE